MSKSTAYCGAYSALGNAFEYLNDDCGYEQWSQYLINKLQNFGAGQVGVDIGCGNGYFTRALCKAGYAVTGVDISPQMLNCAVELARKQGVNSQFLLQDITKLNLNFKADFAVAVNDCLNYVPKDKLSTAFSKVYRCLKKSGIFIFDISSEHKLRDILGSNLFAEAREDISYTWFNTLKEDRVEMDITVFTRRPDGLYQRADERQTQYIHGETELISLLHSVGFTVTTEGHLGGSKEERINFLCKKI